MKNSRDKEFADVQRFNERFGLMEFDHPGHLDPTELEGRIKFLQEEIDELRRAAYANDLAEQVDALIDIVYVAKSVGHMLGICWEKHWEAVHSANMKKIPGVTKRGLKRDAVKPEGWRPPDHDQVLAEFGYYRPNWVGRDGDLLSSRSDGEAE